MSSVSERLRMWDSGELQGMRAQAPPGHRYDVGGFCLHLKTQGRRCRHRPVVVIEAGNSLGGAAYERLARSLASYTEVVTYDRAGLGWSDDCADPRDARHVCQQLHRLLQAASVSAPYLLLGHSIGGLFLRVYAGLYPAEVAGAVFLDASHPRSTEVLGSAWIMQVEAFYRAQQRAVMSGMLHAADRVLLEAFADMPGVQGQLLNEILQPRRYEVSIETSALFEVSSAQAIAAGGLGDRPVLVVTAPEIVVNEQALAAVRGVLTRELKLEWHAELAALSSRGRLCVIEGSEHGTLILEQRFVDAVAAEIVPVLEACEVS